ncbi:nitroreductase family protein [Latilactobacillus sakei]|uniref:nitroreductase family protein n=1 Tax=Latilactobacillus sakei TaxID=1599 RepID=UPI00307A1EED
MTIRQTKLFKLIKRIAAPYRLRLLYSADRRRFLQSSFELNNKKSVDNLRGEITFEAHAIEKGLTHIEIRPLFGKKRIETLKRLLRQYVKRNLDVSDSRFLIGVSVLKQYVEIHQSLGLQVPELDDFILEFDKYRQVPAGSIVMLKNDVLMNVNRNFEKLAWYRHSVRDFGTENLNIQLVINALKISQRTPSVCNRQPWKNYIITDSQKMKKVLSIQSGIDGMASNVQAVSVITTDNSYFGSITEHNQGFIDGGLYAMSFIYALTQQGLATCALNMDFNLSTSKAIRDECGITEQENLILVVAIGTYPDNFKVPVSSRDDYARYTTFIK